MIDQKGFIHCPVCGRRTKTKVNDDTVMVRFPLFCPACKRENIVDVENGRVRMPVK